TLFPYTTFFRGCQHPFHEQPKAKREKTRKYSENYLKFAFTYKETDGDKLPVCVVCSSVLSNETMKPLKLQRHLKTPHAHWKYFFYTYFLFKIFPGPADLDETISQSVRASFKSLLSSCITCRSDQTAIHNCGKFNIASSYMCKTMFGKDEYVKKLKSNTMTDQIRRA